MKFEAATIKDIAKALGLSASTVSRAMRDSYEISAATKAQVLAYAKQINYHPNPIALSLREKRSRSIGVVVAEIANSFYSQIINGIESVAHGHGYHVVITQTHESYEQEVNIMQFLASRAIDGCLVSISSETQDTGHFANLYDKGFPLVFFDRVADEIDTHKVVADNFGGAYQATMQLLHNNKRIAVLSGSKSLSISWQRIAGYTKAMQDAGLPVDRSIIRYCTQGGLNYSEVENTMNDLLQMNNKPDAILTLTDNLTTNCVRYCKLNDVVVPDELCLAGFSNLDLTELMSPALSVVRQPAFDMGKSAAELLIQMIEAKHPVQDFTTPVLPTEFLVRDSSIKKCEAIA